MKRNNEKGKFKVSKKSMERSREIFKKIEESYVSMNGIGELIDKDIFRCNIGM